MAESKGNVDTYLLFGRLAVKYNYMTAQELRTAVEKQVAVRGAGRKRRLGDTSIDLGFLNEAQRDELVERQSRAKPEKAGSYFGYLSMANGFVNKAQLGAALKGQKGLKEQGKQPPKLGQIFARNNLMTPAQVRSVLDCQARLRTIIVGGNPDAIADASQPIATDVRSTMSKGAAAALAKLAALEARAGGAIEIKLDESELPDAPASIVSAFSQDEVQISIEPILDDGSALASSTAAAAAAGSTAPDADAEAAWGVATPAPPAPPAPAHATRSAMPTAQAAPIGVLEAASIALSKAAERSPAARATNAIRKTTAARKTTTTAPPPVLERNTGSIKPGEVVSFRGRRDAPVPIDSIELPPRQSWKPLAIVGGAVAAIVLIYAVVSALI